MSFTVAGDPRSPWPFGDPVATALLGLLEVELRGRGLHWRVIAPESVEMFRDSAPAARRRIDVSALRERMVRGAKADWPDLVEQAVAGWLAEAQRDGGCPGHGEASVATAPAWAAPLRSRLLPAQLAAATAGALARPALPGLTEVVLCETGPRGGGRLLAAEQAGSWPAAHTEIFAAARANVRRQGALPAERLSVDGARLTMLSAPGPYCPTHVFWLDEYLHRDGFAAAENGALVVLPHRHMLAYHAIESTEAVAAAGALLRLASRQFETAPGPLTDQIYWWRTEGVSALPVDSADDTLRILPHPEFEGLLARLPSF
ncbi:MAG TPA: hypothetical protein VH372_03525 [Actinospica sp.]|nr:hypothetical protein [Actinospica sp.]